jgi:hypothetical protein
VKEVFFRVWVFDCVIEGMGGDKDKEGKGERESFARM